MYLIGDIGNTEIKISLVNSKKNIIKKINFSSNNISSTKIKTDIKSIGGNMVSTEIITLINFGSLRITGASGLLK